jgi:hypothetical protein
MPYGVYPVQTHRESSKRAQTDTNLAVRIRTRIRRSRLDSQLAHGAGAPASPRARARRGSAAIDRRTGADASALVETLGDARRGEADDAQAAAEAQAA